MESDAERQLSTVLEIEGSAEASTYQWKRYETMLDVVHTDEQVRMLVEKEAVDRINAERQVHQEKEGRKFGLVLALQFQAVTDLEQAVHSSSGVKMQHPTQLTV